jgi:hypothetical protein
MRTLVRKIVSWLETHPRTVWVLSGLFVVTKILLDMVGTAGDAVTFFPWLWNEFVAFGQWTLLPAVVAIQVIAHWDQLKRFFSKPPFAIRPICGQTFARPPEREVIAKLAIKNTSGKPLNGVSVRLMGAYQIMDQGFLWDSSSAWPSIHPERAETFLFRWSSGEPATPDRKLLNIPSDGAERIADCLILNISDARGSADFAAANPDDIQDKLSRIGGNNWWKLIVLVADDSGSAETIELVAAVADRDPGPITLDYWHPRGEQIMEDRKQKARKESGGKQA